VLVIGSANVDVSVRTAVLPRPGETVIGRESLITLGGKGANQAVAAAACGAATWFVGRIGGDAFGGMVRDGLAARHVRSDELKAIADATTGLAVIGVEDSSRNSIIVVPGANDLLTPADLDSVLELIQRAAVVILQCEIPMQTVYRCIELCGASGTAVILNPAPYRGLDLARIAQHVSYLVPNETEASQIAGQPIETVAQAQAGAAALQSRGIECVIVTLGAQGCVVADARDARHYPGHAVTAIDTTGAGDAFVGCLAAALLSGRPRDECIRRALLYSALSTTRRGAQASYPAAEEFERAWSAPGSA
jgi:ribokinase